MVWLGIYISSVLVLEEKSYQAACEVPAQINAKKAMALCSLWTFIQCGQTIQSFVGIIQSHIQNIEHIKLH